MADTTGIRPPDDEETDGDDGSHQTDTVAAAESALRTPGRRPDGPGVTRTP
ncbi:hypothetical protein [Streptomyces sp. NPDC047725]|uniref:hypothetical protein n=1 Tax=Streptomyces sp. NPDC047725 TaxID=3365487 RepID=UPI003712F300